MTFGGRFHGHQVDLFVVAQVPPQLEVRVRSHTAQNIAKLKSLLTIDLFGTTIEDEDVQDISSLPKLESLVLDSTEITSRSLEHLAKCKKLGLLSIYDCRISQEAICRLQKQRPCLTILCGQGATVIEMRRTK